jgi:hypothetical protein
MSTQERSEIRELTAAELEQVTGSRKAGESSKEFIPAPSWGSSWGTDEAAGQRE